MLEEAPEAGHRGRGQVDDVRGRVIRARHLPVCEGQVERVEEPVAVGEQVGPDVVVDRIARLALRHAPPHDVSQADAQPERDECREPQVPRPQPQAPAHEERGSSLPRITVRH
jgi:hypothetical protein